MKTNKTKAQNGNSELSENKGFNVSIHYKVTKNNLNNKIQMDSKINFFGIVNNLR